METITILRPYFRLPNHSLCTQNFRPRSSSTTTCSSFSLSISCITSNSKRNPVRKTRFLINPFRFLVPFLHNFKNFFISGWEKLNCGGELSIEEEERYGVLECGGIGTALLSTTLRLSPVLTTLSMNPTFVSGLFAWATAQFLKFFLNFFVERKWDFRVLVDCGGMPSSHAALCTALTTSVALCHGISDSLFPVCLGFTLIVMYDATGVRRHAGMQAEVLNMIVEDMFKGHPVSERKLKELLGHTPSQVFAGAFVGIFVAYLCCQRWLLGA